MEKTSVIKLLILHTPKKSDKGKHYLNLSGKAFLLADKVTLQPFIIVWLSWHLLCIITIFLNRRYHLLILQLPGLQLRIQLSPLHCK